MFQSPPAHSKSTLTQVIPIGLGLLLLAAAGLKLYGMNVSPFAQYGWLVSPTIQVLAVLWEIALGLWLISGVNRLGAWLAAVITFLAFAIVSGYLGVIGQASCGCFGMIKANPWWAFGVDLTALILLALTRPSWSWRKGGARGLGHQLDPGTYSIDWRHFGLFVCYHRTVAFDDRAWRDSGCADTPHAAHIGGWGLHATG